MSVRKSGVLALALILTGHTALADPITQLRCLEADWRAASQDFVRVRATAWQAVDAWLRDPAQAHCARDWRYFPRYGGAPAAQYAYRCLKSEGHVESVLSVEAPDKAMRQGAEIVQTAEKMGQVFSDMADRAESSEEIKEFEKFAEEYRWEIVLILILLFLAALLDGALKPVAVDDASEPLPQPRPGLDT